MRRWIVLALVGLAAQLVDGSLGMAYGVTSATLLLAAGAAPATASASVHLAELGTTLASGASHWRFGNVDWTVVRRIALPGAVGAFLGATVLSRLSAEWAAPGMSAILLGLGVYLLVRFTFGSLRRRAGEVRSRLLVPVGLFAGFVDASGGGGWGPVATPALLADGRLEPRKVIGTVDTSEFAVAVAASAGFFLGLGSQVLDLQVVTALLAGGVLAAPLAAYLVRHVPPRVLGAAVGGLIVLTNSRTILRSAGLEADLGWVVYGAVAVIWAGALSAAVTRYRRERDDAPAEWGDRRRPVDSRGQDEERPVPDPI